MKLLIAVSLFAVSAGAQVPALINYQGRLVDNGALVNGQVSMVLRLYDASSGGLLLCADSNQVAVADGLYATYLGDNLLSGSLSTALTNVEVWLEVEVDGTTLSPRERLSSVAYARVASGVEPEGVTREMLGFGAVTSNKIDWASLPAGLQDGDDVGIMGEVDPFSLHWDGSVPMAGPLDMAGFGIVNVADAFIGFTGGESFGAPDVTAWKTAYGWGNHADSNYLTESAAFDLYVVRSGDAMSGALGLPTNGLNVGAGQLQVADNTVRAGVPLAVDGLVHSTTGGFRFPDGSTQTSAVNSVASWSTSGNADLADGANFLGTTDLTPLDLRANNRRGLRIQPVIEGFATDFTPNVIGGGASNATASVGVFPSSRVVQGGAIGGGGSDDAPNIVADDFGVVGGGEGNTAGLDDGFSFNTHAVVGGGSNNTASGLFSVIPGGSDNAAAGAYSFAVGRRAKANHNGSFVFADATDADFATTDSFQFLVRASGGVGFNGTPWSTDEFHIRDDVLRLYASGTAGSGGKLILGDLDRVRLEEDEDDKLTIYGYHRTALMGGPVGVGTTTPNYALDVVGDIRASTDLWIARDARIWGYATVSSNLYAYSDVVASGDYAYSATRTGHVSVAAAAFVRQDDSVDFTYDGRRVYNSSFQPGKKFFAPVTVPDGCTLQKMTVYVDYYTGSSTGDVFVDLYGAAVQGSVFLLASVFQGSRPLTNGTVVAFSDAVDVPETVDNSSHSYYITFRQSQGVALHAAILEYTYDELGR